MLAARRSRFRLSKRNSNRREPLETARPGLELAHYWRIGSAVEAVLAGSYLDGVAEIELLEIDVDGVGQPRNDGTRGSALYRVPIKLSATPSRLWAEIAVRTWDSPPSYTTMHRPGIASVSGDCFVLDGTTVEEVEEYHAETLKLVIARANELTQEAEERIEAEKAQQRREAEAHTENVETVAKRITF